MGRILLFQEFPLKKLIAWSAAVALCLGLAVFPAAGSELGAASQASATVVGVTADSYVDASRAKKNFGSAATLYADASPVQRTYLRFSVPVTTDPIVKATLQVYARGASTSGYRVHGVAGAWTESKLTYANAPAPAATSLGSSGSFSSGWTSTDVTASITSPGVHSFALVNPSSSAISYSSREAGSGARLVIETLAPAAPSPIPTETFTPEPTVSPTPAVSPSATPTSEPSATPSPAQPVVKERVFAYYYLWWSQRHWEDKLGPNYPFSASPWPLPATLDESGCNAQSLYDGNQLIDAPSAMYSQDDPGVIENHVRQAAAAGLSGFIVNWRGTGAADQTADSVSYSRRLAEMFRAVNEINAEGKTFKLWIQYKSSDTILTTEHILNDWAYLKRSYATDPAFDRSHSSRPTIVFAGSRKYPLDVIRSVSQAYRDTFFIVGDENWTTWGDGRAEYLDGDQYYWSSQNPYTNANSFTQLKNLADSVRASGPNPDGSRKLWFAPFTPGYNSVLLGGSTCVPRNGGDTMRRLYNGNLASSPDAWVFISWNEIAEGTYVEPLQRWGDSYLNVLTDIIYGR